MTLRTTTAALSVLVAVACGADNPASPQASPSPLPPGVRVPISEMPHQSYLGFEGGLYPGGANSPPASHAARGISNARAIRALAPDGSEDPRGHYVLLSIGMSNTTQEFCSGSAAPPCEPWSFMGQAAADPAANASALVLVNGAFGGKTASAWDRPDDPDYDRIRSTRLAPLGLTEAQVQAAWVKVANAQPKTSLPAEQADAFTLVRQIGDITRALRSRYPNLQQVFLSSRIYAGYATTTLNPEPYAYESGFAVKWAVAAQIQQMGGGSLDGRAGDLDYAKVPWLAWGPYLWADGSQPRADGLFWIPGDLQGDGTHPSRSGQEKVGTLLLDFFKGSRFTRCWFVTGGACS